MAGLEAWIADCHLQDRDSDPPQDYTCRVAVWADGYDMFRARLAAYLEATAYKILWVEECLEALEYIKRHGQQAKVGGLARAVHLGHPVELGTLTVKDGVEESQPEQTPSFREALLALDYKTTPVFAVLDGAQFDNLPEALFDGDFISRPLYLDRGENDPEQIITAPHMVTLDERTQKVTGRSYEDTLEELLGLVDNKPAAVFWQCPEGGEVLYKHLRGINMVLLPKVSLPVDEQELIEGDEALALFRHADANVLSQVMVGASKDEAARLFGPARKVLFLPEGSWLGGKKYFELNWAKSWPPRKVGMLSFSEHTLRNVEATRETALLNWSVSYFTDSSNTEPSFSSVERVRNAFHRAIEYGLDQQEDIWSFIRLDIKYGHFFEKKPGFEDVYAELTDQTETPQARIHYATQLCEELGREMEN